MALALVKLLQGGKAFFPLLSKRIPTKAKSIQPLELFEVAPDRWTADRVD
jgi:hypothetical protein